ncbi:hypothetical protein [Aeromonas sp. Y318-3]|uniref:hypothetical protein n=1 Tax=Aeromonas sp. Y318-3 TaxID=2990509 RepID=UPI0022E8B6A6|nr:hypothetical protein [Aeromonas sp. Y318-3]
MKKTYAKFEVDSARKGAAGRFSALYQETDSGKAAVLSQAVCGGTLLKESGLLELVVTACDNEKWAAASPTQRRSMLVAELAVFLGHTHQPVEIAGASKPAEPTSKPESEPEDVPVTLTPTETASAQSTAQPTSGEHPQEDAPTKRPAPGTRRPIPDSLGTLD